MTHHDEHHTHDHSHDEHTHDHAHDHAHGHEHAHAPQEPSEGPGAPNPRTLPSATVQALHQAHSAARTARRAPMRTQSDVDVTAIHERAWSTRVKATEQVIAATEELLARAVAAAIPNAAEVVLYEDHSHDAPHGHVLHIADANGTPIMSGTGDDWHDASWTETVDEYVWDLHHLDREGFQPEGTQRIRRIPIR